jgi:tRNA-specific 2-thiouridylase
LIATGHYAQLERHAGGVRLRRGSDPAKDQSYFLHQVPAAALAQTLFPIGGLRKDEVRRRAHAAGLPVFDKPDSTGICFIGERPFEQFLRRYIEPAAGPIETDEGRLIGEHRGLALYTLGQRSGLGIGGRAGAAAKPWYVADKRPERNALVVVQDPRHPLLLSDWLEVADAHWLEAPPEGGHCAVQVRHRQRDTRCRVRLENGMVDVRLDAALSAVTPGQYAVFYDGSVCLGGGVIARRGNSRLARSTRAIAYHC